LQPETPTYQQPIQSNPTQSTPPPQDINALEQHVRNLLTPSTPYFFNTLYDPYREGADFVVSNVDK
jgi:hypothetical protein